jgi:hypothetical protein
VVAIWDVGLPITIVVPIVAPVWQVAQLEVMPMWFMVQFGAAKPPILVLVLEWQVSHAAVVAI